MHFMGPLSSFLSSIAKAMEDRWAFLVVFRILSHTRAGVAPNKLAFGGVIN
jgi:hypothetical protein